MIVNEHVMPWHLEFHPKVEINVGQVFNLANKDHPFWFQLIRIEPKLSLLFKIGTCSKTRIGT
jgi:hypothetical protein